MSTLTNRLSMLVAALSLWGCTQIIGAGEPLVTDEETGPAHDEDTGAGGQAEPMCGDGVVDLGEECDDGNGAPLDGCRECRLSCDAPGDMEDVDTGVCYHLVKDAGVSWDEAEAECEKWGGTLATTPELAELDLVRLHVNQDVWLGGVDDDGDGMYAWVTGEPWQVEEWMVLHDGDGRQCTFVRGSTGVFMNDDCALPKGYFCERTPAPVP